mgnify:CR=1 FL=1
MPGIAPSDRDRTSLNPDAACRCAVPGTKENRAMDANVKQEGRIGVLEELLNERYSVRAFLPQQVDRATIEHVLQVAQRTASWCNSQPWQVLIASGEAKERFRKAIYAEAASGSKDDHDFTPPREYLGVYQERRRETGFQLYNTLGIPRGDKAAYTKQALENYNFFGAPHVAIIHTDEALGIYGAVDCGGYVGNFMLAAQALGLGTIPQAALARHSGLIRRHFKLPDDRRVVCGISFGYADDSHKVNSYRTSRASVADTAAFLVDAVLPRVPVTTISGLGRCSSTAMRSPSSASPSGTRMPAGWESTASTQHMRRAR